MEKESTESFEMTDSQFEDDLDRDASEEDNNIMEDFQKCKIKGIIILEIDPTERNENFCEVIKLNC